MTQRHAPTGSRDATGKKNGGQFRSATAKPRSSINIEPYGPNTAEVENALAKTRMATPERIDRLSMIWADRIDGSDLMDAGKEWRIARLTAFQKAVSANRANMLLDAESLARNPYTGEMCCTTRDAITALVVRDLISSDLFSFLYGPWASVMEEAPANA